MQTETSIEVNRPIQEVFAFTTRHVAEWSLVVQVDEVIDDVNDGGVGTTFRTVTEDHGCRMDFQGQVARHEPPTGHTSFLVGDRFDMEADYQFKDLGDGRTRVTQNSTVKAKGFLGSVFFLFGWMMRKSSCDAQQNELNNLKRLLEQSGDG